MAIKEQSTGQYIKVLFNECKVVGLSVYASYRTYKDTSEREKEKSRESDVGQFLINLRAKISERDTAITNECESYGINRYDRNENGESLPNDVFDRLLIEGEKVSRLMLFEREFIELFYGYSEEIKETTYTEEELNYLETLGYNKEWVADSVKLLSKVEAYCGEYNGETICHEFYYNKLKENFDTEIVDV